MTSLFPSLFLITLLKQTAATDHTYSPVINAGRSGACLDYLGNQYDNIQFNSIESDKDCLAKCLEIATWLQVGFQHNIDTQICFCLYENGQTPAQPGGASGSDTSLFGTSYISDISADSNNLCYSYDGYGSTNGVSALFICLMIDTIVLDIQLKFSCYRVFAAFSIVFKVFSSNLNSSLPHFIGLIFLRRPPKKQQLLPL